MRTWTPNTNSHTERERRTHSGRKWRAAGASERPATGAGGRCLRVRWSGAWRACGRWRLLLLLLGGRFGWPNAQPRRPNARRFLALNEWAPLKIRATKRAALLLGKVGANRQQLAASLGPHTVFWRALTGFLAAQRAASLQAAATSGGAQATRSSRQGAPVERQSAAGELQGLARSCMVLARAAWSWRELEISARVARALLEQELAQRQTQTHERNPHSHFGSGPPAALWRPFRIPNWAARMLGQQLGGASWPSGCRE